MGREIRRVPPGWEHPKNEKGRYQPLFDKTYLGALVSHFIDEYGLRWHLRPKNWKHYSEWLTGFPNRDYYRPRWKEKPTHYQIYETVSEGTPTSPVFETLDEMKEWLLEEGFSEKAASKFVESGYAPSMIGIPGKGISGLGIHSLDWL